MRQKTLLILGLIFGECSFLLAQKITTFTTYDGLVNNVVFSVFEDRNHDLWFGTAAGLGRRTVEIDSWEKYTTENSPLTNNKVNAILQDVDGNLWFATDNGLCEFNGQNWTIYTNLTMPDELRAEQITCLYYDTKNNLWIGTMGGGVTKRYRNNQGFFKWLSYHTGNSGIVSDNITTINEDSLGNIWFGTLDAGICSFDGISRWMTYVGSTDIGTKINVIFRDHNNQVWFGTSKGLFGTFDGTQWISCGVAFIVRSIAEDWEGNLWLGTESNGLYKYNRIICSQLQVSGLENVPTIWSIVRDHNGYIWLGTNGAGALRLHLNWIKYNHNNSGLVDDFITSIDQDLSGNLWLGTATAGIARFDGFNFEIYEVDGDWYGSNFINSILVDRDNWIWCATENGAHKFNCDQNCWISYFEPLPHRIVNTVIQDQNGILWFGTWNGISRFDGNNWTTIDASHGLPSKIVTSIFEDHQGYLWFGTSKGGVCKFDGDSIVAIYNTSNGLIDNYVTSIIQDSEFNYWFGTFRGISKFNGNKWNYFTKENSGLPDNNITCLLKDEKNNVWIGTNQGGLAKFDGKFWTRYSIQQVGSIKINDIFQDSKGSFWFGTPAALINYIVDRIPPETILTYMPHRIIGTAATLFTFIGIDIETPIDKLVYSWKLLPDQSNYVSSWSEFNPKTYCEVHCPFNGSFYFMVKAKDEDGNEDQSPASYRFTVDTSAPITIINSPTSEEFISGKISVIGTAFDDTTLIKDFKCYWLDYASEEPIELLKPSDWNIINDTLSSPVINDELMIWDTSQLIGTHFLRLSAMDSLDHISRFIVRVNIVETLTGISSSFGGTISSPHNRVQLYIPPNALNQNVAIFINPEETLKDTIPPNSAIKYTHMVYKIGPDTILFKKPVTLTFNYNDSDIIGLDEQKLAFMRLHNLELSGGLIDAAENKIQTTIKTPGTYILVEDNTLTNASSYISDVNCQPRIFSPQATGFAEKTNISFQLAGDSDVTIKIYNLGGRLVRALVEKKFMHAGNKSIEWNGRDRNGNICPSDLYIVTIESEKEVKTKTVVILDKSRD